MDATGNFFIIIIAIFLYFFLIGLVYIKVVNPQYPLNWVLVMDFMLGLNNYDNFQSISSEKFTTRNEGFSVQQRLDNTGDSILNAGNTIYYKLSTPINRIIDYISLQFKRLLVKLYIHKNTFYSTQRIQS